MRPPARALAPEAAALLRAAAARGRPSAHLLPLAEARRALDAEARAAGPGEPVAEVADLALPAAGAELPARLYRPGAGRLPAVVYLHGGGWVLGSIDSHDAACRALANASGAAVLSVGYRRAPEHRFPTAAHDAYAAVRWLAGNAGRLGLDGARLAVAGDSAGGNLALAAALQARERGPALRFLLLVYPVATTDLDGTLDARFDGVALSREELRWHQRCYFARPEQRRDALASPLERADLRELPPALVITAGCDPLRPQGERLAAALRGAGVPCGLIEHAGMPHGFFGLPQTLAAARAAAAQAGAALGAALAPGGAPAAR